MVKSKVAVVGGSGFLGSHVFRDLLALTEFESILFKRSTSDLRRLETLEQKFSRYDTDTQSAAALIEGVKPAIIVYCATNYGRNNEPAAVVSEANYDLPKRLFEAGIKNGLETFVYSGTSLPSSVNEYARAKNQLTDFLRSDPSAVKKINLALEHFYGPGDDDKKFTTHITRALLRNEKTVPLTLGQQQRDFIYIDDAVRAFRAVLANRERLPHGFSSFDVCSGKPVAVREFVECVKAEVARQLGKCDTELLFGALPYRPGEPMECNIDFSALATLGWAPQVSLQKGISLLVEGERSIRSSAL